MPSYIQSTAPCPIYSSAVKQGASRTNLESGQVKIEEQKVHEHKMLTYIFVSDACKSSLTSNIIIHLPVSPGPNPEAHRPPPAGLPPTPIRKTCFTPVPQPTSAGLHLPHPHLGRSTVSECVLYTPGTLAIVNCRPLASRGWMDNARPKGNRSGTIEEGEQTAFLLSATDPDELRSRLSSDEG